MVQEPRSRATLLLAACLLLALAAQSVGLFHPLFEPDEGRNALVALEMARSGEVAVPRLEGLPYLDKPALFFAWVAASLRTFGISEAAARLPSLASGWLAIALVGWLAARLFSGAAAVIAMLVLATTPLAAAFNQIVIFDSALALLVTGAIVCFYLAVEARPEEPLEGSLAALAGWVAAALAVLVKGPIGLLLPVLVVLPYALWRRRARRLFGAVGLVAFVLVVAPWLIAVELREPGFLRYALVTETWSRLTTRELDRAGPVWTYVPVLLGGAAPWVVGVLATARARWRSESRPAVRRAIVLLVLWVALPFVFFSLSQSKRPQYLLPVMPAVALLATWCACGETTRVRFARSAGLGILLLGGALVLVGLELVPVDTGNATEAALAVYREAAVRVGVALAVAGAVSTLFASRTPVVVTALAAPMIALPLLGAGALGEAASGRSARELATALEPLLGSDSRVVGVEAFSPALVFYTGRPIVISTKDGFVTTSNYIMSRYDELVRESAVLKPAGWWRQALQRCDRPTFFLARTRHPDVVATLAQALPEVGRTRKLVLFGPCRKVDAPTRPPSGSSDTSSRSGRRTVPERRDAGP